MADKKPMLACASSVELGSSLSFKLTKEQLRGLKALAKKSGPDSKLPPAAHELAMSLWLQITGVQLPAALTFEGSKGRQVAMVVRKVEMWCDRIDGWALQIVGLNIRKTGSTGNSLEWFYVRQDEPFKVAQRTLLGEWKPIAPSPVQEVVC
jgi:hypothetical protein